MATFTIGKRKIRLPKGMSQQDAQAATEFFEKNPYWLESVWKKLTPKEIEEISLERWLKEALKALGHIS